MDESGQLEVINEDEEVQYHASARAIHQKNLLHKSVHALIIDSLGRIYCRFRTAQQPRNPGWTASAGAHVPVKGSLGQTIKQALEESLGLKIPLVMIGKIRIKSSSENEISATYLGYADEVHLNPKLKEVGKFFTLEDIKELNKLGQTTPHLTESIKLYLQNN